MRLIYISRSLLLMVMLLHLLPGCSPYSHEVKTKHSGQQQEKPETAGYLGFNLAYSPADQYFVSSIDSQSEAWTKGIRVGFSIVGWNRQLIADAISAYSLQWGYHPETSDIAQLMACQYLTRGEPGSSVELFFVNDQKNTKGVRISYFRKPLETTPKYVGVVCKDSRKKNEFINLNDSLAYIRLSQFIPSSLRFFNNNILDRFDHLSGLIIDLRENTSGDDRIAVKIANHFVTKTRQYESPFNKEGAETLYLDILESVPAHPQFTGRVIIITGPMSMGAAEGFVNLLQKEDKVDVLGSWKTTGSFSIKPDILIPPSKELIIRMSHGEDVLLMEAVGHLW